MAANQPRSSPARARTRPRGRTLLAVLGLGVVGWLLVHEFGRGGGGGAAGVLALVASAAGRPLWLAAAAALAAAGFVVATMSFVGFVPERLDLRRSLLAQLAGGFANMVAPAGLGGMALGTRFLHRSGIPAGQAVTSVGVSQVVGVALHGLLVVAFGVLAGTRLHLPWHAALLHPSAGIVITATAAALTASAVVGVVCCSPRTRRWAAERLRAAVSGNLPRMVDLARRQPGKVAVGVTGQLLVSLVASACLYACGVALGERTAFAAVALANLVGGTVGLAVPTPGGVGGVEAVLAYALTTATGVPYQAALVQVLLYRLLTLWLPVLPGWAAYAWLLRKGAL